MNMYDEHENTSGRRPMPIADLLLRTLLAFLPPSGPALSKISCINITLMISALLLLYLAFYTILFAQALLGNAERNTISTEHQTMDTTALLAYQSILGAALPIDHIRKRRTILTFDYGKSNAVMLWARKPKTSILNLVGYWKSRTLVTARIELL